MTAIRVKAMLVLPHPDGDRHLVSRLAPTRENPEGYHRLIGGSIEPGERAVDAARRELDEELGAAVDHPDLIDVVESIYRLDGTLGHEVVFVFSGRLTDPHVVPDEGRWFDDGGPVWAEWIRFDSKEIPLYPDIAQVIDRVRLGSGCADA
jgi:8-oxo-dGTP pyrophosphatase MutT (NUDIX family)